MEQFLIITHILGGGTVLTLGLFQMFNRKGSINHKLIGRVYVGAMWWICLSALMIISFYRFSAFLMVIAVLTFHSSFTGVRVLKRKEIGSEKWYDWTVSFLTALFGVGLFAYGGLLYFSTSNLILALLCLLFGIFTAHAGIQDLLFYYRKNTKDSNWWLQQHIGAMGGSYIAAITAFAVQNPNFFLPGSSHQWLLWILPAVIGSPIITISIKKWKRKMA